MYQLRHYQEEAVNAPIDYFSKGGKGHPLIALPTGTGKSIVIAEFIRRVLMQWPSQRVIGLTHVKELIEQNGNKIRDMWPDAPLGIYSSGLKTKQSTFPIIFGGVASVVKNVQQFGHRDLMFIDEAHLLSHKSDTMYHQIIAELTKINPYLKVIGYTATPYRMGQGLLTDDGLFTDIVCDWTSKEKFNQLIRDGFLAPLIPKHTHNAIDTSNLSLGADGDFNKSQLEDVTDKQDLNYQICKEMIYYGNDRNCWLVFAAGVKHANHIADMLCSFGIPSCAVYASMGDEARKQAIGNFKCGKLRCLVNNNVLTTGFDHPPIDFIGMLRPTTSTGLWVQMAGRGTRPSPETLKQNCLLLDFAGNRVRLGAINDPYIPRKKGEGKPAPPPTKICPMCGMYNHATVRNCEGCGYEFPPADNLNHTAGTAELIVSDQPQVEWFDVTRVIYNKKITNGKPPSLKVTYICFRQSFDEYILLEHTGGIAHEARAWWKKRMGSNSAPPSIDEAIPYAGMLKVPIKIQVHVNKKYPEIVNYEFQ